MFDHTVPNPRNWTFAVSLTAQSAMIGTLILISMAHVEKLDLSAIHARCVLQVPFMRSVEIVPAPASGGPARFSTAPQMPVPQRKVFTMPTTVPHGIPTIVDTPLDLLGAQSGSGELAGSLNALAGGGPLGTQAISIPKPPSAPPKPPVERMPSPVLVASSVLEAMLIRRVVPVYPPIAKNTRTSGTVHLLGVVSKEGRIERLQVIDGHPLLVQAALDAVRQWLYRPTQLNGNPVEVTAPITVRFILN